MNDWYQRMLPVLQLNGKGEPTQKAYTRMVRMLSEFYGKTPDLISEPELQEYFLHRKNVSRMVPQDHAHLLLRHSFFLCQRPTT